MKYKTNIDHASFYAENSLGKPSELFNAQIDIFYFAKDLDGRFVCANDLLIEHFGMKNSSELIGKTDFDVFRRDLAEQFRRDDLRIMADGVGVRGKLELVPNGAGEVNWFTTTKAPLRNITGEIVGIEGLIRDVNRTRNTTEPYSEFKDCINFVQKNYMRNINIRELAEICCMSMSTFERRFKKHFGSTPSRYIKRLRINEACELLLAGFPAQRVALDCGFCDQSYFTREFRKLMGMTPRQFKLKQAVASEQRTAH